jgi:hypothetical protein
LEGVEHLLGDQHHAAFGAVEAARVEFGSSPITRPSGSLQPRSMTTLRSRQWRLICTSGSTTASLISQ